MLVRSGGVPDVTNFARISISAALRLSLLVNRIGCGPGSLGSEGVVTISFAGLWSFISA